MRRDRFYQYSADERIYDDLLDRACINDETVMEACIEEILDTIAWQERSEMALNSLSFPRENKQLTEEEISLALKKHWITDNTLN